MLPDIRADAAVTAAKVLGVQFMESMFFRCALENGYGRRAEDKAHELMNIWARHEFADLPQWVRDWCRHTAKIPPVRFSEVRIKKGAT